MTTTTTQTLWERALAASDAATDESRNHLARRATEARACDEAIDLAQLLFSCMEVRQVVAIPKVYHVAGDQWSYHDPTAMVEGITFDVYHTDNNRRILRASWVCPDCTRLVRCLPNSLASLGASKQMHLCDEAPTGTEAAA